MREHKKYSDYFIDFARKEWNSMKNTNNLFVVAIFLAIIGYGVYMLVNKRKRIP